MVVSVFTALLDKGDLIEARILEALEMRAELVGRANPTRGAGLGQRDPHLLISRPDIGATRLVLAENIVMRQRITEELESIFAAALRFPGIRMHRETCHHRDIGIDRVADRHALSLDDPIVIVDPLFGLCWIDKGES